MNTNLFTKELKRNRKNLIIWTSIVVGFTLMVLSIFPYMKEMGQDMTALMAKMPEELSKAMGMDANTWSNILGFYSTYYGIYIVVLISIFTTSSSTSIISKEEKDQTSEFLLTRPISRTSIFNSKMLSLLVLAVIIYSVQTIVAIIGINVFKAAPIHWDTFAIMHIHGFFLMVFFTCLGVLISMFVRPKKNFMGIVVGLTFGSYFINAIGQAADAVNWVSYFSPFHYLNFNINSEGYSVNYFSILILTIVGFGFLFIALKTYLKKDISG